MNSFPCNMPLVTVYIPCRNYGRFIDAALNSMNDQLYTGWELFIVDEASEDDTLIVASYFKAKVSQRVIIIHNPEPLGLQRVANNILALARGKYIVRLDADDWFDESALLLMTAKLESDHRLGIVYGNYYYTNEDGAVIGFERKYRLGKEDLSNHIPPHGACTMVRTNLLKSVGGYSENMTAQDGWELWFKLLQRTNAANLEAPIFFYRQHGSSLSRDTKLLLNERGKVFSQVINQTSNGYRPTCLAVIPAKESYPHFEGVPYAIVNNKTLLQIAIEEAQRAESITDVVVSSESKAVLDHVEDLESKGLIRPLLKNQRSESQTLSSILLKHILLQACGAFKEKTGRRPDIVLYLSLHVPFRKAEDIDRAISILLVKASDSVVSVHEERDPVFAHGPNGLRILNPGRFKGLSHERERLYTFNGSVIAMWYETLQAIEPFGDRVGFMEMERQGAFPLNQEL